VRTCRSLSCCRRSNRRPDQKASGADFVAAPADEGRILDARIDDEIVLRPVAGHGKSELALTAAFVFERVTALHRHAHAVDFLVGDGRGIAQHADRGLDEQRARTIQRQTFGSGLPKLNVLEPRAGTNAEFVLQDAGLVAQPQVNSRPQVAIDDVLVAAEPCVPSGGIAVPKGIHLA